MYLSGVLVLFFRNPRIKNFWVVLKVFILKELELLTFKSRLSNSGSCRILPESLTNSLYDLTYLFLVLPIQSKTLKMFAFFFLQSHLIILLVAKDHKTRHKKGNINFLKLMLLSIIS